MRKLFRKQIIGFAGAAILASCCQQVLADDYPSKPIRFVVPASPGGATDGIARSIANGLADSTRWTTVVENFPGAAGNIGLDQVAKAPGDGYTIGIGESSNLTVNQFIYSKMPFNPERDIAPVMLIAKVPLLLLVPASVPYRSVADLVAEGKKRSLSYATPGNGTLAHLTAELWKQKTGLNLVHIPYKSAPPAMTDLAAGLTDLYFASIASATPMLNAGKVKALAILAPIRSPKFPAVPTFAEAGFEGMEASALFGVVAPGGTPKTMIDRLNKQLNAALSQPSVVQQLSLMGADRSSPRLYGGDAASFNKLLQEERVRWGSVVKASGAKID